MGKNLFLLILLFCIVVFIINFDLVKRKPSPNNNIESFIDTNFKVDNSKISEEKSVRFTKLAPYNASRIVYGFNDLEYFNKNKDNIFNFYGIDNDKLKSYFDEKYDDIKKKNIPLENYKGISEEDVKTVFGENIDNQTEIGIGGDKEKNIEKIYILVDSDIYSLKKDKDNNYIESVYKDDFDIKNEDIQKYLGKNNYKIINDNIEILRLVEHTSFTDSLKIGQEIASLSNTQADLTAIQNLFDRDLKLQYKEQIKRVNELHCFTRYDNNVLTGYNFDIGDKKLYVKDSKPFLEKLLTELGCNIENIDTWIKDNADFTITYISFITKNDDIYVTIYYTKFLN
jgi:hypothetical protein